MKRVLVVLLLYSFGKRVASTNNFLGLVCCTVGLLVYAWDKRRQGTTNLDSDGKEKSLNIRGSGCFQMLPNILMAAFCIFTALCLTIPKGHRAITVETVPQLSLDHHAPRQRKLNTVGHRETFNDIVFNRDKYFSRSSFLVNGLQKPTDEELHPILDDFSYQEATKIKSFLKKRVIDDPRNGNFLSEKLTKTSEVIREAQRLHFNIFQNELKQFKYAIIFGLAVFENKGDTCIGLGEMYFLKRFNLPIISYCSTYDCTPQYLEKARNLARNYTVDDLVILVHGGGNLVGYAPDDRLRFRIFNLFAKFKKFVFPQSIFIKDRNSQHVKNTIKNYCCVPNLTIVLRDQVSYDIAKDLYKGSTRLIMAPDMAFQIGHVERFMSPVFDIVWVKRKDPEAPGYSNPINIPGNLRVHISDWYGWLTPKGGSNLETSYYIANNGFLYLQRGRVIVTDRLHGHILATLMDIPHVAIDNKYKKISGYHNTWTKSLENTVLTSDPSEALDLAIALLKKYNDTLPPIAPFLDVSEHFKPIEHGKPITDYP